MADNFITHAEATVLIDQRIALYDKGISDPKHVENRSMLSSLNLQVNNLAISMTKIETTASILMKIGGAGIGIWSIKQIVELVHTLAGK